MLIMNNLGGRFLAPSCNMRVEICKFFSCDQCQQGPSDVHLARSKGLIFHQDLPLLYKAIKQDIYDSEERKLSIFVSVLEPDSVCALRILQACLPLCMLDGGRSLH